MSVLTSRNRCNAFSCAVPLFLNLSKYQDPLLLCKNFADPHAVVFQALLAQKIQTESFCRLRTAANGFSLCWQWCCDNAEAVVIVK